MFNNTPRGQCLHIALFGKTNAGKSTLFNLITGQENAIVSDKPGTTTDPVVKNMELSPVGAVTLIDTAGFDDNSVLGEKRKIKTLELARRADLGVFVVEACEIAQKDLENLVDNNIENVIDFEESFFSGEKIYVFTKCDLLKPDALKKLKNKYKDALYFDKNNLNDVNLIKNAIINKLSQQESANDNTMLGGLVERDSIVIMVVPIDNAAPKGRLILPQVQLLRECLDNGIRVCVTRETELERMLEELKDAKISLVVTDSQVFSYVDKLVPANIRLTSFSMLAIRQKCDITALIKGVEHIELLKNDDCILMLEACTHNYSHEDIGRVKIPKLINKVTGLNLRYEFFTGYALPENFEKYSMAVICGSCMINQKEVSSRLKLLNEKNIPVTNYGVLLAYLNGILDRCTV